MEEREKKVKLDSSRNTGINKNNNNHKKSARPLLNTFFSLSRYIHLYSFESLRLILMMIIMIGLKYMKGKANCAGYYSYIVLHIFIIISTPN
jgi:hypothetical protein